MAVKTVEEILASVSTIIGDNSSDEALTLLEDIQDTFTNKANNDSTDWEKKYHELDTEWRNRYKERFLTGNSELDPPNDDDEPDEPEKPLTFENLFKEG